MSNPETEGQQAESTIEVGEFDALLKKEFKPKTDGAKEAVENAVKTLAQQVLDETATISDDVLGTIESMIAEIDKNFAGLRPLPGADDPTRFKDIDHPRRPGVAKAEPPLQ